MKAIVCPKYGTPDVVQVREVDTPVPGDRDVLVRVHATTVTSGDDRIRGAKFPALFWLPVRLTLGLTRPRHPILGDSFAGVVQATGRKVSRFRPGDRVFGSASMAMGCHAEYVRVPEDGVLAALPDGVSFEEGAATYFGGHTALHFLRKAHIRPGQRVLVYGASGGIGTFAVQLARHFGADVTGVCSTANVDLVRSLGAHEVLDYTRVDFTRTTDRYDVIFDTVGKSPFTGSLERLNPGGYYLRAVHLELSPIVRGLWATWVQGKKVVGGVAWETLEDLVFLGDLVASGAIRPVIDGRYDLEEAVEAHRRVDGGHKRGEVVLAVHPDTE